MPSRMSSSSLKYRFNTIFVHICEITFDWKGKNLSCDESTQRLKRRYVKDLSNFHQGTYTVPNSDRKGCIDNNDNCGSEKEGPKNCSIIYLSATTFFIFYLYSPKRASSP
ncbi:hypothetical protein L6452_40058 [Arctium lappa]|uniref:Uncharacterized protein n=1 Tax=Arctium lappa TaxID=4217 RepID=A0ACB8XTD1_ARCLA|nr:hypothetical protein L6452_40058 [Arctium lappa]